MEAVALKPVKHFDHFSDDYHLIQQAVLGNQQAFAFLMNRYHDALHRTVQRMVSNKNDAEDLTLEAFGKAFHHLESYRPHYAFSTWLFRIAINNCIDHIRKKRLTVLSIDVPCDDDTDTDYANFVRASGPNPEEHIIREQRRVLMRRTLEKLNPRYRLMIELRYFEELSYDEIAEQLDLPIGTVKAQLFRAREALHTLLSQPEASDYLEYRRRRRS